MNKDKVAFSVIIPTYKDWQRLQKCLDALDKQTFPLDYFEVLIINNDTSEDFPPALRLPKNARIYNEPKPGSYAARNFGIKNAIGEIIAFTDSDCIPDKDWLKNGYQYFKSHSVDRIGGKVQIFFKNKNKKTTAELYESVFAFQQEKEVQSLGVSVTANLMVEHKKFLQVGKFDSTKLSGEDYGWNRRATEKGLTIVYRDDVIVYHPARHAVRALAQKKIRVTGGGKKTRSPIRRILDIPYKYAKRIVKMSLQLNENKELSYSEKLRVFGAIWYLESVATIERIRLLWGKPRQ